VTVKVLALPVRSSVRLLETRSSTSTSELLWLASSWVSNEQELVVLDEKFLQLTLALLVVVFLVVSNDALGNGLTDGLHLGARTTTAHADADAQVLESVATKQEEWLVDLHSQGSWLKTFDGLSINSDVSVTIADVGDGSGILLSSESLYLFFLTHLSFLRYGVLNVGETLNNN